jgi:hypothetical protein
MAVIRLGPFFGANLALRPKLLSANVGVRSLNHWPDRGDLRPWREPLTVATAPASTQTMAILKRDARTDTVYWLKWSTVVHVVNSFNATGTTKRTYFTGSGAPKVTDNILALAGEPFPTAFRDLGIPQPMSLPSVVETTPGTGDDETRFYAYAYVSDWDEVGPAQVSVAVTCKPGALLDISGLAAPPSGGGNARGINRIRVWRTQSGATGAEFFFLRDITVATSTTDDARALGTDVLDSQLYAMPPADLKHLTGLWNGMMAGITGNSVRYCEQFKPHAWPAAYETLCMDTPIALAVFQKNLLILTTGRPRMVNGSAPEAMDDVPVEFIAACVSERSVVAFGHGACWATADGLAYVGTNGAPRLLTEGLMLLDDWKALNPSSIVAGQFNGKYMGFYEGIDGLRGFMLDPMQPDAGIYFLTGGYSAVHFDALEEELYVLEGTNIRRWNGGTTTMTAQHRTKVFRQPYPLNMSVCKVIADVYPCTVTLFADDQPPEVRVVIDDEPFWFPPGYLAENYQIEVETVNDVTGLILTDNLRDLTA